MSTSNVSRNSFFFFAIEPPCAAIPGGMAHLSHGLNYCSVLGIAFRAFPTQSTAEMIKITWKQLRLKCTSKRCSGNMTSGAAWVFYGVMFLREKHPRTRQVSSFYHTLRAV